MSDWRAAGRWAVGMAAVTLMVAGTMLRAGHAADPDAGDQQSESGLHLRTVKAKHYAIRTDLDDAFATELATRMDVMYDEYQLVLPQFKQPANSPALPAFLFAKQSEYSAFTHMPPTSGVFVRSAHPFLAAQMENGRDEMRKTLQHEAFHQFAFSAIGTDLPTWLNEGLAQEFEEGVWTGKNFWMRQVPPERLRMIQSDIAAKRLIPFKNFMAITPEQWFKALGSQDQQDATNYNEAWAIAHFLLESGSAKYHDQLIATLMDIHKGMDGNLAFSKEFPNLLQLQSDFSRWFVQLKPSVGSLMVDRQRTLGDFLIVMKRDGGRFRFNSMADFRQFVTTRRLQLTSTSGRFSWKTSATPEEYFCDLSGHEMGPSQLTFGPHDGDLPADILCAPSPVDRFRTHFYQNNGKVECEVLLSASN